MKKVVTFAVLALAALFCAKERKPVSIPDVETAKTHWLHITCRGKYVGWTDSVNTYGWIVGKDVVSLFDPHAMDGFCYPWQGEDSLDFRIEKNMKGITDVELKTRDDSTSYGLANNYFLWADGKLVGGYYSELSLLPDSLLKGILTIEADYDYYNNIFGPFDPQRALSIDALKRLPKLSVISADINWWDVQRDRAINTLKMIPSGVDIYLTYGSRSWEDIGELAEIKGLRSLNLWCYGMPPRGILKLAKVENLKRVHFLRGVECRLLPFLQAFLLGLVRPDCEIEMPGRRR
ncbi:hypothetical protein CEE36_10085 [candidate division TA06 bacterium B3_TA06]|uniref:Uncharacterized protein n=1 Tax=candidate division TA06 bacterium B3_TA06 TaxID=2012487 RepID=A0A532UY53_UNCT6|nr:MAG: hypothetical protein CEE36_10085 [candidate division TA06 bacterium B3_TA06]